MAEAEVNGKGRAKRKAVMRQLWLTFFPCIGAVRFGEVPTDTSSTSENHLKEEDEALETLGTRDDEEIRTALSGFRQLHAEEEERKKGVEARLTTILGMSSIVAAITFGFVSAAFDKGYATRLGLIGIGATAVFLYAILQLVISVWQSVHGLRTREFQEISGVELLRRRDESSKEQLIRSVVEYAECVRSHDVRIGEKIERLDVAHRALLNFLCAMSTLVVIFAAAGWVATANRSDGDLANELLKNSALVEALRGQRGERGDAGPPGPTGAQGPVGPEGRRGPVGPAAVCPQEPARR